MMNLPSYVRETCCSDGANTSFHQYITIKKESDGDISYAFFLLCSSQNPLHLLKRQFLNLLCQAFKFPAANLLLPLLNFRPQPLPPLPLLLPPLLAGLVERIKAPSILRYNKPWHLCSLVDVQVRFECMRILNIKCADANKRRVGPTASVVRIHCDVAFGAAGDELTFAGGGGSGNFEGSTRTGNETGGVD